MEHYVCPGGCGMVADQPGTCTMQGCPMHGRPLAVCNCEDGQHTEVMEAMPVSDEADDM